MTTFKNPKFIRKDLDCLQESQALNVSMKQKQGKRKMKPDNVFHDFSETERDNKKQKINQDMNSCGESQQRTLNVMNRQLQVRKQIDNDLLKDLTGVITNLESDHDDLRDKVQKLEQVTACFMKCMQQATAAHKEKLKAFKGLFATFKEDFEEIEGAQNSEIEKLGSELEHDISKLKQKLISETKRTEWENLQKTFFRAMQNNF